METFVLIYAVVSSYGHATASVEFGGKEACELAGAAFVEAADAMLRDVVYICVRKNGVEGGE